MAKCVQSVNFEKKLLRKSVFRRSDWKKVVKLFSGWGSNTYDEEVVKKIAKEVSLSRINSAVEKKSL